MADFVNADISTDPTTLLDTGIDTVNQNLSANGYPNWTANDAALAVIIMGVMSQWAADVATVASTVTPAIFRAFGTELCGIPYVSAGAAYTTTTWTFTSAAPAAGYTVPSGTQVEIDGTAFYVASDYTTGAGAVTLPHVRVIAAATGTAYNGLGGVNQVISTISQIDWVASVTTDGATLGGTDQESDTDYQDRLAQVLQLQAPRPITASDFAKMVLSLLCVEQTGITVGRATAIDGWYPSPRPTSSGGAPSAVLSCTLVSGSTTVTVVSGMSANQVPTVGATVTAADVPSGVTVAGTPAPTPSTFTLSVAATASATENVTVGGISGYLPAPLAGTGTVTSGSTAVSGVSGPYLGSLAAPGATVTASGVTPTATVALTGITSSSFRLSTAATGTHAAEPVTLSSWAQVARCVTVFVTDPQGMPLGWPDTTQSAVQMDTLAAWLAGGTVGGVTFPGFRELNFLVFVMSASYTPMYVSAQIHVLPGWDTSSVTLSVATALANYLSPASWGNPTGSAVLSSSWLNYTQGFSVVRFNSIIGVIEAVPGVQYAVNGGVFLGTTPSPAGTADITLSGPAPLVQSDAATDGSGPLGYQTIFVNAV